jgi:hypothetical protein
MKLGFCSLTQTQIKIFSRRNALSAAAFTTKRNPTFPY